MVVSSFIHTYFADVGNFGSSVVESGGGDNRTIDRHHTTDIHQLWTATSTGASTCGKLVDDGGDLGNRLGVDCRNDVAFASGGPCRMVLCDLCGHGFGIWGVLFVAATPTVANKPLGEWLVVPLDKGQAVAR